MENIEKDSFEENLKKALKIMEDIRNNLSNAKIYLKSNGTNHVLVGIRTDDIENKEDELVEEEA